MRSPGISEETILFRLVGRTLAYVGVALAVSACGPAARPDPASSPAASAATAGPTIAPNALLGYLAGQASIGPLQPVERVGVPPPTPSPAACAARGLVVFDARTGVEAARFELEPDCTYQVALPAGSYRVELQRRGIDASKDLPRAVTISAGQVTRLDISIDTGIR